MHAHALLDSELWRIWSVCSFLWDRGKNEGMGADSSAMLSQKLHKAIGGCDHKAVRELLSKRADPNERAPGFADVGGPPVYGAALWGRQGFPMVAMLLSVKADPSIAHLKVRDLFSFQSRSSSNASHIQKSCLSFSHPVQGPIQRGHSVLHLAATYGCLSLRTVKALIESKAPVNCFYKSFIVRNSKNFLIGRDLCGLDVQKCH